MMYFESSERVLCTGMFVKLNGIPEPPSGYVPPLGASLATWTNIYKNKGRIDYCVQQFGVSPQPHRAPLGPLPSLLHLEIRGQHERQTLGLKERGAPIGTSDESAV